MAEPLSYQSPPAEPKKTCLGRYSIGLGVAAFLIQFGIYAAVNLLARLSVSGTIGRSPTLILAILSFVSIALSMLGLGLGVAGVVVPNRSGSALGGILINLLFLGLMALGVVHILQTLH